MPVCWPRRIAPAVVTMPSQCAAPGAWRLRWLGGALALLALAGCGSLPKDVERPVSTALADSSQTSLGQLARRRQAGAGRAADSGFALVDSPDMAYASRLALTRRAEKTLDIQYYAIHADTSTAELLREVRQAAARGVRVRILLDDFNSAGQNERVMGMAFVPGVEMRMFNPLPSGRGAGLLRVLSALHDFRRMQHRMHNKLYIADNAWGITGGRNLGDAYFGTAEGSNFIDMDVLAAGAVVREMSASFDRYWNNPLAYPVAALVSRERLRMLRQQARAAPPLAEGGPPPEASRPERVSPALPEPLDLARQPLVWAPAQLLVDEPRKLVPELNDEHQDDTVVDGLLSLLRAARREVLIVSPYFVPGPQMMAVFEDMRRRGVRVRVLTNSLASNDAPLAHAGYARYRKQLLRLGVALYEMRALKPAVLDRTVFGSGAGGSRASLHAKVFVIDGRVLSIGSMNLDLRSKLQNSEVALVIRSAALSREAAAQIDDTLNDSAWAVELGPEGRLRWRAPPDAGFDDADGEPDASLGLRLLLKLLGPLAPDELL